MDQISLGRALLGVLVFLVLLRLLNFVAGRDKLAGWLFTLEWGALVVSINCALAQMGEIPVWVSATNISAWVVGVALALYLAWRPKVVYEVSGMFADSTFESSGRVENKKVFRYMFLTLQFCSLILISLVLINLLDIISTRNKATIVELIFSPRSRPTERTRLVSRS